VLEVEFEEFKKIKKDLGEDGLTHHKIMVLALSLLLHEVQQVSVYLILCKFRLVVM